MSLKSAEPRSLKDPLFPWPGRDPLLSAALNDRLFFISCHFMSRP